MKISNLHYILILFFLIFTLSGHITAMGVRDESDAYKSELQQIFDELITDIYSNEIDAKSAKNSLKALRTKFNISYTDEAGIIEAIIDRADEEIFTRDEAQFYFQLLNEGKLMDYRHQSAMRKSEMYHLELLALLREKIHSSGSKEGVADDLLNILNNYYNFVGLEYDKEYLRLSSLINSLKQEQISFAEMKSSLNSIDKQLTQSDNQLNSQADNQQMNQGSTEPPSDSSNQQDAGSSTSKPSESPQGTETSGQSSQGSGSNSNTRK